MAVDFLVDVRFLLLGCFHRINHGAQVADNAFQVLLDLLHVLDQ